MKSLYFFLTVCSLFLSANLVAQDAEPGPGTIVLFSEGGERFTFFVNGERKNGAPDSRVVASVNEAAISMRIVFENGSTPEITKRAMRQGTHCTYMIAKNKKGEYGLKMGECSSEPPAENTASASVEASSSASSGPVAAPAQLSATYANGVISINDGRTLKVTKVKANGMTYPRVMMTALTGAEVAIKYDSNNETFSAETPFQYEVKDFSNNNAYFTLTVDEGGPAKTWKVKLQNANGFDLKIE